MRFLVTGANGFLGGHLVRLLVADGANIVLYTRKHKQQIQHLFPSSIHPHLIFWQGELGDMDNLTSAMKGCDGIFHLAGSVVHSRTSGKPAIYCDYPRILFKTNVDYSVNIVNAAAKAKVKRVVMASTSGVVGCRERLSMTGRLISKLTEDETKPSRSMPNDDSPYTKDIVKEWPYYLSKILAEERTLATGVQKKVEVIWMRPSMLVGPGDFKFRSIKVILSFLHQTTPIIPNGYISIVDVRDVAEAFLAAMQRGTPYRGYSLSSLNCSLADFYDMLERISLVKAPKFKYIPDILVTSGAGAIDWINRNVKGEWDDMYDPVRAEMSAHDWSVDPIFAQEELEFYPRDAVTSLEDTVNWIEENQHQAIKANL